MKYTDEQIKAIAFKEYPHHPGDESSTIYYKYLVFIKGAKWMRDQMQSFADQSVQRRDEQITDWIDGAQQRMTNLTHKKSVLVELREYLQFLSIHSTSVEPSLPKKPF